MELYVLDHLYRRVKLVDRFESLIWTERFSAVGDFELKIQSNPDNRAIFVSGVLLAVNESFRVMTVEMIEDTTDSDGRMTLTIKGRSLESVLENRLAWDSMTNLTSNPNWALAGTATEIARQMFHDICVDGDLDDGDVIPGILEDSSIFPVDTTPEPTDPIVYTIEPMTLYSAIKGIADLYAFGFRIVRDYDTGDLYFDVYPGSDRTSQQDTLPAVIFSASLDNLQNTTSLTSTVDYKNVAYVVSPVGHEIVYPLDVDPDIEGFERRVLFIKADDITEEDLGTASELMIRRGTEELSKYRKVFAFDGEINQDSRYKYGIHYNLGDIVELRDDDATANTMQVTEQIFVSDAQGDRSYPTLSLSNLITPGSWLSWEFSNKVWDDFDTEHWADLP